MLTLDFSQSVMNDFLKSVFNKNMELPKPQKRENFYIVLRTHEEIKICSDKVISLKIMDTIQPAISINFDKLFPTKENTLNMDNVRNFVEIGIRNEEIAEMKKRGFDVQYKEFTRNGHLCKKHFIVFPLAELIKLADSHEEVRNYNF